MPVHVVVTGAGGFIGKNLCVRLHELARYEVTEILRKTSAEETSAALLSADFVIHLAGINRPKDEAEFSGNEGSTRVLCERLAAGGRKVPVAYASSAQAGFDNPYGRSKRAAEQVLLEYARKSDAPVYLLRLTNVFGKWGRPHYNSAVATFCYQISRALPITIHDASSPLKLTYVDDVVEAFVALLERPDTAGGYVEVAPVYETTVGEMAQMLRTFSASRASLLTERVGTGFARALYSTYVSYLPPDAFDYAVPVRTDPRGEFVEMLKTADSGQFSYFTAHPGITRGEHYHHSKTEKFLIVRGTARFVFRNLATGEMHEITTQGGEGRIVETVPGWAHKITNVGADELLVMLWANENFDHARPDTVAIKVVS
jgi:UDP-2-acetamido-2,6-beta-L-arabino-hexul-4-ose reductase